MRGVARVALVGSLVAVVAGCGGTAVRPPGGGVTPAGSASASSTPPSDPHYQAAAVEARRLLSLARLPDGAVALPAPSGSAPAANLPLSPHLVDEHRQWSVPLHFDDTVAWIAAHPPAGLAPGMHGGGTGPSGSSLDAGFSWQAPDTAAYVEAQLVVTVSSYGENRSLVAADGVDVWLTTAPEPDHNSGPAVQASIAGGCPASVTGFHDVANADPLLATRMLPAGDPLAALVCRYPGSAPSLPGMHGTRRAQVTLDAAQARRLAQVIAAIRLGFDGGGTRMCPADTGEVEIIVFHYATGADVALWYSETGCAFLDNGRIVAREGDNASFSGGFVAAMNALP